MNEFIERLKQRKLIQWGLAYVAAAFALIQVLDIVAQRFAWPEQTIRVVILVLAVGFFVALVVAWYHGERGVQRVTGTELLILTLLLAIGGGVAWRLAPGPIASPATAGADASIKSADGSATTPVDPHSIAVLPFVNMSGDSDNQYFSDGISEEILNVLARIPDLRVAARTSSFSFRDGRKEAPEIGRELRVRNLLEGSVRKQGGSVRITAQLIDTSNGYHLFSQTYDRELKDIFAVQDEIARAIAGELQVKIGGGADQPVAKRGTQNLQAYDFYLRGQSLWQERGKSELLEALRQFTRAVDADPKFADAYAGLSLVYSILPDYSAQISYAESLDLARDNAERALALDPALPEPYVVLGYLADGDRRRDTAVALYRRAIALRPSSATAYQWLGNSLWSGGQLDAGVTTLEHASLLDPRSPVIANNHAMALIASRRYGEAVAVCDPIFKSIPDNAICGESTGLAKLMLDDLPAARIQFEKYALARSPGALGNVRSVFDALQGHGDRHAIALQLAAYGPQSASDPNSGNIFQPYVLAPLLSLLGEPRLALSSIESFVYTDRTGMSEWAIMQPALGKLRCETAFVAMVAKIKAHDPYYASVCTGKP
ncbi:MAG: tetratricopeptide repeat protein [Rudaea sp.]